MAMQKPFPHASFLSHLGQLMASPPDEADADLPSLLSGTPILFDTNGIPTRAADHLHQLLTAKQAVLQAAFDTEVAADELRRYQKFAKPGQPSPHIVQLRQKQAAARHTSSQSRQRFIQAAASFVKEADIKVSPHLALEAFINSWIEANVPRDAVPDTGKPHAGSG